MINRDKEKPIVVEELDGDIFTPISIFQLLTGEGKFLLESSLKHTDAGRYSFIGVNPSFSFIGHEQYCEIVHEDGAKTRINKHPLDYLKTIIPHTNMTHELSPFIGGAVGYIGYDVMKGFFHIWENQVDELQMPHVHLMFYEQIIAYDHLKQKIYVFGIPLLETTTVHLLQNKVNKIIEQLKGSLYTSDERPFSIDSFQPSMTRSEFVEKVKAAQKQMKKENISQVVISQRMAAQYDGEPFTFYRKLRVSNPSPYMFYIDFLDYILAGSSPESVAKVTGDRVVTNPIAGTRPRGKTNLEDEQLENDLLQDEKELTEHKMLAALSEAELASVCDEGTVTFDAFLTVEKYAHVMHLVSILSGKLKNTVHPIDVLVACLPAGTVSGLPKKTAMKIIGQLEDIKRGVYGGAIGYVAANGDCNFALAIRMMVLKDHIAYAQAGAGIVQQSVPELEYEETIYKLKALLEVE